MHFPSSEDQVYNAKALKQVRNFRGIMKKTSENRTRD